MCAAPNGLPSGRQLQRHAKLVLAGVQVDGVDLSGEGEQRQRRELLLEAGKELAVRVHLINTKRWRAQSLGPRARPRADAGTS